MQQPSRIRHAGTTGQIARDRTDSAAATIVEQSGASAASARTVRRLAVALVLLTALLYGRGLTHSRGFYGDSFQHLINGIFVYDALCEPIRALKDPVAFGYDYYRHFPAVNIGYYPPVFSIIQAGMMGVLGVSPVTGQLAVLMLAIGMTLFSFAWFRLRFDPWWAAAGTAILVSTPHVVFWGRDIMLEVPVLAFMMGSVWSFERVLRTDRPAWSATLIWALLTSLAFWTKQHSLLLLGVFAVSAVAAHRWRHLATPSVLLATALVALSAAALIALQLRIGGDAVEHSIGSVVEPATEPALKSLNRLPVLAERANRDQWTFYLRALPRIVGWPTLVLAPLGLFWILLRRETYIWPTLSWLAAFYAMHSYFAVRDVRYGVLWVPPFAALAVVGLRHLGARSASRAYPGAVLAALLVLVSIVQGARVRVPVVPSAYQRAAEHLADEMGRFACLSYLPDRPSRLAVCYRLALEERRTGGADVRSFGRVLRAIQLHRAWKKRWPRVKQMAADLKRWNVKYIVLERPHATGQGRAEARAGRMIHRLLKLGEFRPIRAYPVKLPGRRAGERTLVIYKRKENVTFIEDSVPEVRTKRIPRTI